jgi:uncharacterized protein
VEAHDDDLRARLSTRREQVLRVAARYGAHNVRVFGSVARGDHTVASDIDLLIDLDPGVSLFTLSRLRRELSDILGSPVDLVTSRSLLPRDEDVLREAQPL